MSQKPKSKKVFARGQSVRDMEIEFVNRAHGDVLREIGGDTKRVRRQVADRLAPDVDRAVFILVDGKPRVAVIISGKKAFLQRWTDQQTVLNDDGSWSPALPAVSPAPSS